MATLTIKNIPDEVYERLKESAKQHRRSINSEVITCLEKSFFSSKFDPEEFLARVRATREKLRARGVVLTEEELYEAKNEGRP